MTEARALRLAHRGDARRAPENTIGAFTAALADPRCDGLEFDVRASADGVPIVLHDIGLARVQGVDVRASRLTAAELAGHGIPTLAAVLAVAPPSAFLDVELKEDIGVSVVPVIEAARGPDADRVVVSAFAPGTLATIRALRPGWPCWLNTTNLGPGAVDLAGVLGCAGISSHWHAISAPRVRLAHDAGLVVAGWTVLRRSTFDRLERIGVGAVCVEAAALDG